MAKVKKDLKNVYEREPLEYSPFVLYLDITLKGYGAYISQLAGNCLMGF